jgi:hypothetical protein
VGSKTYDGVWFTCYSHDHAPPHVHGLIAGAEVIIDLLPNGRVVRSPRAKSVKPANAKKSDVRRILIVAAAHVDDLKALWEKAHGKAS